MSQGTESNRLSNQVVLITGGSRGIGKAIASACSAQGAVVVISARSKVELSAAAAEIQSEQGGKVVGIPCDISEEADVQRLTEKVEKEIGPVYGLVCAAGIYGSMGPFESIPFSDWRRALEVNLVGAALCIHKIIGKMKERRRGRIILFSGGGQASMPRFSAYVTSKGGIWRLTETLAAEFAPFGIYVNSIAPGAINTRLLDELLAAGPERVGEDFYQRSVEQKQKGGGDVSKSCDLALYLLSPESEGLSGRSLSALWDPFRTLGDLKDLETISKSDLYTMRRVVNREGGTRNM